MEIYHRAFLPLCEMTRLPVECVHAFKGICPPEQKREQEN